MRVSLDEDPNSMPDQRDKSHLLIPEKEQGWFVAVEKRAADLSGDPVGFGRLPGGGPDSSQEETHWTPRHPSPRAQSNEKQAYGKAGSLATGEGT